MKHKTPHPNVSGVRLLKVAPFAEKEGRANMIQETYRDVEITYMETENKWRFTANGRERNADSLVKAREAIDRAVNAVQTKEAKPWQPFEAYLTPSYASTEYQRVRVTSVADENWHGTQVWIVNDNDQYRGKGTRSKESAERLFKINAENDATIAEIRRLNTERTKIDEQISAMNKKLVTIEIPKDEE